MTRPVPQVPPRAGWLMFSAVTAAVAASVLLMTLSGCASPAGISPAAKVIDPASVGVPDGAQAAGEPVAADWWKGFGDPALDQLVERALAGNPNLKVAQARLVRAQSGVDTSRAAIGPQGSATASTMRQHYSDNGLFPPPIAGATMTSGDIQLGGSWEFDFFGRHRAAIDAALGTERAAQADIQAARVLLASQVARGYLQLARLAEQREVAVRALAQRDEMLSLIRQRVQAGLDTNVELRQGEGALPETRQQLEAIDEQMALARHALAALTAQPPAALDAFSPRLQAVRALPAPADVPADLLGRRADVSAARWRIEAATQDARALRAQFYPNVNLTGFVGLNSIGFDKLLRGSSEQWGIGPAVHLPLFDAARLRAGLRGKTADIDAAVETYNAAVIDAVREVADQLASLRSIERQQREQQLAQDAAESAYSLATQRYRAGLGTLLVVLNAESNLLNQRRLATDLKTRALEAQVGLVRSLGGGYADASPAAAPRQL
jgi:NodT family efflux transporter outer membrane factor (OMF) lipoprotein